MEVGQLLQWPFIVALIILLATTICVLILRKWLDFHFKHFRHVLDIDPRRYRFLKHFLLGFLFLFGVGLAVYLIPTLRSLSVSIFAGAGVLAIILGFAAQQALSNVISGIFLAVFKPFRVGDWITVGTRNIGVVEDITLRHTVIRDRQNKRIIIPNSVIGDETIENSSIDDSRVRKFIEMSISYDADIDKALLIMEEEALKHPETIDGRTKKEKSEGQPVVKTKVVGFADSAVILRAWVWTRDPYAGFQAEYDLYKSIKQRFDKEGIEIPFPYRTIVYKKDLKR